MSEIILDKLPSNRDSPDKRVEQTTSKYTWEPRYKWVNGVVQPSLKEIQWASSSPSIIPLRQLKSQEEYKSQPQGNWNYQLLINSLQKYIKKLPKTYKPTFKYFWNKVKFKLIVGIYNSINNNII